MSSARLLRQYLDTINAMHQQLAENLPLKQAVTTLRLWQMQRLEATYHDLSAQTQYMGATRFMIEDVYGAKDFSQRDKQMEGAYSKMVKLLPEAMIRTVSRAMEFSIASMQLDMSLAEVLLLEGSDKQFSEVQYCQAIRKTDSLSARLEQIELMKAIGYEIDIVIRKPLIGTTLKMLRKPAELAGLGELQDYLERGFRAFKAMKNPKEFFVIYQQREQAILRDIFKSE